MKKLKSLLKRYFRKKRIVVLMYHRVADLAADPWGLAVTPSVFEEQIALLTKHFHVLTVDELYQQLQGNHIKKDSICITFDDGYSDNFLVAKPILEKYKCPATFFIATYYLKEQQPYWWDDLEKILLHSIQLPPSLEISINGQTLSFSFEDEGWLSEEQKLKHRTWNWEQPPPTQRCAAYYAIWEKLRPLPHQQIQDVLMTLRSLVQQENQSSTAHFPMTFDQLTELASSSLFTIGLHTHTHPALKFHSHKVQLHEIEKNKRQLQNLLNRPIDILSYPYGLYDDHTLSIVNDLKIRVAFTTNAKFISTQSSHYKLGRVQVQNQDEPAFLNNISRFFE